MRILAAEVSSYLNLDNGKSAFPYLSQPPWALLMVLCSVMRQPL